MMASNEKAKPKRITHEQHAAGVLWAATHKDELEKESQQTLRHKLLDAVGISFTREQAQAIAKQAGIELIIKPSQMTGNGNHGDKARILAAHVVSLYQQLGVEVPESLDMIRKAKPAKDIVAKHEIERAKP